MLRDAHDLLLERLHAFSGGFEKSVAQDVCADSKMDAATVGALLDELVLDGVIETDSEAEGGQRYRFASPRPPARLDDTELLPWRKAHAYWYLDFIEGLQDSSRASQEAALEQIEAEHANILRALDFSFVFRFDPDLSLRLCIAAFRFWFIRGFFSEGIEYTLRSLNRVPGRQDELKFKAMSRAGNLLEATGDLDRALAATRQARDTAGHLGNRAAEAGARGNLATILRDNGRVSEGLIELGEAVRVFRELQEDKKLIPALCNLAAMKIDAGELEGVVAVLDEVQERCRVAGDIWASSYVLFNYGEYYRAMSQPAKAAGYYRQALLSCQKFSDDRGKAMILRTLAECSADAHKFEMAAKLFGAAEVARDRCRSGISGIEVNQTIVAISEVREALGEVAFRQAWESGRNMPDEDAERLAASLN